MRKIFVFLAIFQSLSMVAQKEPLTEWGMKLGGKKTDFPQAMASDDLGHLYIVGSFLDTIDLYPKRHSQGLHINPFRGSNDGFIAKYDTSGKYIWSVQLEADKRQSAKDVSVDAEGNVYITGFFEGKVDFNPGVEIIEKESAGYGDGFLLKLNENGKFQWVVTYGGPENDYPHAVTTDSKGNVYLGGGFKGSVNFNHTSGSKPARSMGKEDWFVAKYNSSGELMWLSNTGSSKNDHVNNLHISETDQLFITGTFMDSVYFHRNDTWIKSKGKKDIFFASYDQSGDVEWIQSIGGPGNDAGTAMTSDKLGNMLVTGNFMNTADFDPSDNEYNLVSKGEEDIFMASYSPEGELNWAQGLGASANDIGRAICVDDSSNVYIAGSFKGKIDFDASPFKAEEKAFGSIDAFIAKYTIKGEYEWMIQVGGYDIDYATDLYVDDTGNVFLLAQFENNIDYKPEDKRELNMVSFGSADIFLGKYKQIPDTSGKNKELSGLEDLKTGQLIILKNVLFEWGTAELLPQAYPELDQLLHILEGNPSLVIRLEGHTDYIGSEPRNLRLSKARAMAVRNYLVGRGIADERIRREGFGGSKPLYICEDREKRKFNMRVELRVVSWD